MRKILFLVFFSTAILFAATQTTKEKIENTTKNLNTYKTKEKTINKKIEDIGNDILTNQKNLKNIQQNIQNLSSTVANLKEKYKKEENEINKLNSQNDVLINSKKQIEQRIIKIIADDLSFELATNSGEAKTVQGIIADELFNSLSNIIASDLKDLVKNYNDTISQINDKNKQISNIQNNLKDYNDKKKKLVIAQNQYQSEIQKLKKNKDIYVSQLLEINNQQESIQNTLEELKIINDKEEREKARIAEEKRLAKEQKNKKPEVAKNDSNDFSIQDSRIDKISTKIKRYGSSYQASRVKRYAGRKTFSPLEKAYVKRGFGNYIDPVYNMKIFNESVILSSKISNAQVKNVLDGKVIFARETAVLKKVIIVENSNGIHTIYAQMNQIAPTIKVGKIIKKGYIIGRVDSDLTFEVTQKNYHINPLEMITLK